MKENNLNIVFNEDCVSGMINRIEDNSIDLILADSPYQISKPSQLGTLKDRKMHEQEHILGSEMTILIITNGLNKLLEC